MLGFPLLVTLAGALPAAQESAEQEAPAPPPRPGFETIVAHDSLIYLGIDDVAALRRDWEKSAWGRMYADPAAEPVRVAMRGLLDALAAQSKDELGFDAVETADMLSGRFGVALAGAPDLEAPGDEMGDLHGVLAADAGEHAPVVKERVTRLFEKLVERGEAVLRIEADGEVDVVSVVPTAEGERSRISLAAADTTFALGLALGTHVERDDFHRFLAALAGDGKDTLLQLPAFRRSHAAQPGGVKLWVDTGALLRAGIERAEAQGEAAAEELKMRQTLGLHRFGPLASRYAIDANGVRFDVHQSWDGGLLPRLVDAWLAGGDTTLLKVVPVDAQMVLSFHLDLAAGFDASDAAARELAGSPLFGGSDAPADPAAPAEDGALDPKRDFLEHLDGRLALFLAKTDETEALPFRLGGASMNVAVALGVKGAGALRASVDRLLRQQGLHAARRRAEFEGFEIFTLPVMPFMVHYAIADDLAILSMSQTLVQDVLRRKSNPELACLRNDASFQRQLEAMVHPHGLLVWGSNTSDLFSGAGGATLGGLRAMGDPDEVEIGPDGEPIFGGGEGGGEPADGVTRRLIELLQAFEALDPTLAAKHLPAGALIGLAADPEGIRIEGVSR